MTLPLAFNSGLANTTTPWSGPFLASTGNMYAVAQYITGGNTGLEIVKTTDPTTSWTMEYQTVNLAQPNFGNVSAWQDSDTLHIVISATNGTNGSYWYFQYNMATETFVVNMELIASVTNIGTSRCSICKRSQSGEIFVIYINGYRPASTNFDNPFFTRRLGTNSWSTPVNLYGAGASINYGFPSCVPDPLNDRVLGAVYSSTNTRYEVYAVSSSNVLGLTSSGYLTAISATGSLQCQAGMVLLNNAGTVTFAIAGYSSTANNMRWGYGPSSDSPVTTNVTAAAWGAPQSPLALYAGTNPANPLEVWIIYGNGTPQSLTIRKSSDGGQTYGVGPIYTSAGHINAANTTWLGYDRGRQGPIIRGGPTVIPYLFCDNSTANVTYNEFPGRMQVFFPLGTAAVTPNFFGNTQINGAGPAVANSTFGWVPGKTALTTPYYAAFLGASSTSTVASATSTIDSKTGPTKGTGVTNTTAGDSFIVGPLTGTFAATSWILAFGMKAGVNSTAGYLRIRVWKSANANGSGAVELTSGAIFAAAGYAVATTGDLEITTWSPGPLTFTNEYMFFQLEWQEASVGTATTSNTLFWIGNSSIATPDFAPPAAAPFMYAKRRFVFH